MVSGVIRCWLLHAPAHAGIGAAATEADAGGGMVDLERVADAGVFWGKPA